MPGASAPVQVSGLGAGSGATAIDAGLGHSLFLRSNGAVLGAGSDASGQIGNGPNATKNLTPAPVLLAP